METINLADLRVFLAVARHGALAPAADELHLTPSAVSKALRRLEQSLETPLFERGARQLLLNAHGARLVASGQALLAQAARTRADLLGERASIACRVAGPAVLLWRHAGALASRLRAYPGATIGMQALFEDAALVALARGEIDLALVTGAALEGEHWNGAWAATDLGPLVLQLAAGAGHALVAGRRAHPDGACHASSAAVLAHDFACPARSLFCGVARGARSDGWRDDQLPRRIRYWTDDLQVLLGLVRGGTALAYLPDFALAEPGLVRVHVTDCTFSCTEQAWLVWDRARAPAWLHALAGALA